ncbi:hypothetical protein [Couchioplanes caeruleus]|uniref:Uncharacterized protein n=1 Tax=Couchioplanes caeruleus TaxID=56438 RepID=A0A3N1GKS6_9ACTN|nr:hypothetical protein [Couchioplanes caeruleus]ROP30872.1 hypothetical protein EDD30_3738 [Couchioplanes caeruleus]
MSSPPGRRADNSDPSNRTPRWVKVFAIVLAVLILAAVLHKLLGPGDHSMGGPLPSTGPTIGTGTR